MNFGIGRLYMLSSEGDENAPTLLSRLDPAAFAEQVSLLFSGKEEAPSTIEAVVASVAVLAGIKMEGSELAMFKVVVLVLVGGVALLVKKRRRVDLARKKAIAEVFRGSFSAIATTDIEHEDVDVY